jgi:hypothetical protein
MTDEQKIYSEWIGSLDRENLTDETIDMIVFAADDSDLSTEPKWKRDACRIEWIRRDGNDKQYNYAMGEAGLRIDENEDRDEDGDKNRDEDEDEDED